MHKCVAYNCSNNDKDKSLSFHLFPTDPVVRAEWVAATKRKNFNPTKHSRLCSKHFDDDHFGVGGRRKRLRHNVIPTKFDFPPHLQENKPETKHILFTTQTASTSDELESVQDENVRQETTMEDNLNCGTEGENKSVEDHKIGNIQEKKGNGIIKLKISLKDYCRLCAAGNAQLLHCEEVLFDDGSSKTTIKDLVQIHMPDILKDNEERLLPKKICIACVKAMLNWGDFIQRSLNSHKYFLKLLSREFEIPDDNGELVSFIRETKKDFSVSLVRYFSRLTAKSRVHLVPDKKLEKKPKNIIIEKCVQKDMPTSSDKIEEGKLVKILIGKDVQKGTSSNAIKESDINKPNNEFKNNAVITSSLVERGSVDFSTPPLPGKPKVCRARKRRRSGKAHVQNGSIPPEKCGRTSLQQQHVYENQSTHYHGIGHSKPFPDLFHSPNSTSPEKLICSPTVMLYQEVVGTNEPEENDDECRMLDVDNLVDGSTEWVYRLKANELAYVLKSYNLDTCGSYTTLRKRLINHLKQIDADERQLVISIAQQTNNKCNNDECENNSETEIEATEVLPHPDSEAVARDHCYSKEAPPGCFRLEDILFKPRSSGPINMQFFVGMSSNLTEDLIRRMRAAELFCILEICNIEREGSGAIRNKLIRYLNYIKAQPTSKPEVSNTMNEDNAERTLTDDGSFAVSSGDHRYSKDFNTSGNPSDQSDDSPFTGFQSIHDTSGNPSDHSDDTPFRGFQTNNTTPETSAPNQTVSYGKHHDPCSDHVLNSIKTEPTDLPNFDYPVDQNTEFNIKEEPLDEDFESPCSPRQYNNRSYDSYSQYLCLNREIHYELTEYFRNYKVKEDVNKYKCCVALEELHPAIISFYCSPNSPYPSSSSSSSPTSTCSSSTITCSSSTLTCSSSTITCASPQLSPRSSPTWQSPFHPVSPPKKEIVRSPTQKITVKKLEDLC
ncbi:hypothetical protein LSTR_LSTR002991 [Laodelphax striatellus]|uniref:Uncharacterized protein n=1 Tax=Laodelphax striatellus TaxID=195883 RepID=A0A482WS00_LAOST|nr:hypothetical protein LSTR_LSTR002991 [Laodelphax striatellus]